MADDPQLTDLCERWRGPLLHFFRGRGYHLASAEELTQDTLFRVCTSLKEFRGESQLGTWVYRIAKNVHLNRRRRERTKKRRGEEIPLDDPPPRGAAGSVGALASTEDPPDAVVVDLERRRRLRTAVERLPTQQRLCTYHHYYQGRSYQEVARLMQISVGAVKSHLNHARKRLRRELPDEPPTATRPQAGPSHGESP